MPAKAGILKRRNKPMPKSYFVYIMASKKDGVLYTGVTSNLSRRDFEHKNNVVPGFTKKYWVKRLVYYETYPSPREAIQREKCVKRWKRSWKIELIEKMNPAWRDLSGDLVA